MKQVANLPTEDRRVLFEETAAKMNLANPVIAEKDFWVCWTLWRLYSQIGFPRILFKGGTSLPKCFGVIHRFSEDIDLGLERADLDLSASEEPSSKYGRAKNQKAVRALNVRVQAYLRSSLTPALEHDFAEQLTEPFQLQTADEGKGADLYFEYPRALASGAYGGSEYVAPVVKLELGARSDHHPVLSSEVRSFVAEVFPGEVPSPVCSVQVQAPERTLIEKALILHTCCCKDSFGVRFSRHAYDLAQMQIAGMGARLSRDLYEEVASHKRTFADDIHAGRAPEAGIRLVPMGRARRILEADYRAMKPMLFSSPAPPTFAEVLDALGELERLFAAL